MKVRAFRKGHRKSTSHILSGWAHLMAVVGGSLLVSFISVLFITNLFWLEALVIPIAFVLANLVEYIIHRWPMHKLTKVFKKMYKTHSGQHHRYFTHEYMNIECDEDMHEVFASVFTVISFILFIVVPISVLAGFLISSNVGILFFATAMSYYGIYEFVHFMTHLPDDHVLLRVPFMKMAKEHHQLHHNTRLMRKWNFNIGLPLMDVVFGTLYKN